MKAGNLIGVVPDVTHIKSFARLYYYACHYRTKPEATTSTLGPGLESPNFILFPSLLQRLLKIPDNRDNPVFLLRVSNPWFKHPNYDVPHAAVLSTMLTIIFSTPLWGIKCQAPMVVFCSKYAVLKTSQ